MRIYIIGWFLFLAFLFATLIPTKKDYHGVVEDRREERPIIVPGRSLNELMRKEMQ